MSIILSWFDHIFEELQKEVDENIWFKLFDTFKVLEYYDWQKFYICVIIFSKQNNLIIHNFMINSSRLAFKGEKIFKNEIWLFKEKNCIL